MKKVILSQLILITSILISCTDKLENTEVNNNPTNQVVLTSNDIKCKDHSRAQDKKRKVEKNRQRDVYRMRRSHIGSLCHGSVVSCERIGVDHLSVGKVGRNTCVGVIVPHGIAGRGRVPGQRQSGVILPRHLDTVRLARQGDVDRFAVEADLLDRRQIPVSGVFHLPVPMSVVGNAHRIIAPSEKRFLYVFIPRRRTMQEIAPHGNAAGFVGVM